MPNKLFTLESNRLILRDFIESDKQAVFDYQSNPEYLKYYASKTRTQDETYDLVKRFITWQSEKPRIKFQLAIILKVENKLIGNCGIRKNNAASTEAELGCELDPQYWGQGFAFEAVSRILKYAFENLKLQQSWVTTNPKNLTAIKLVEKLHFHYEETLHDDAVIYRLLEQEWQKQ